MSSYFFEGVLEPVPVWVFLLELPPSAGCLAAEIPEPAPLVALVVHREGEALVAHRAVAAVLPSLVVLPAGGDPYLFREEDRDRDPDARRTVLPADWREIRVLRC